MPEVIPTSTASFKDHFSDKSDLYARHRPTYPAGLFAFIAGQCRHHELALDCATGNGQAAVALASHFRQVVGTDASAAQIESAIACAGVSYRVAAAEESGLDNASVDLITVGQALHWFDLPTFFIEAKRLLRPAGVLAVWCYELCHVSAACDAIVDDLYTNIVGPFWPPERVFVDQGYAGVSLPGTVLDAPEFDMQLDWSVDDMLGYVRTWSACKRYAAEHGEDPVGKIENALQDAWGNVRRNVRWPLQVRLCRI